ncbi:hypothetical protein M0805_002616 [Coniferiporia weirii]|nr:hypothetical protein M0805_002616 [Coniferiporia weirii]
MSTPVPALSITHPTPPRIPDVGAGIALVPPSCSSASIPPRTAGAPRLLYRGALSLPDSHLLLDGLTFTIALPADDPHAARTLLATPLALALESMRGRPALRFAGVVRLADVTCDFAGGVTLHVHPRSVLTRQLFAHHLCATHVPPAHARTALGVRVRLGDGDGDGNGNGSGSGDGGGAPDDIVMYGRPHPSSSTMQLCVARVVPAPPQAPAHAKPGAEPRPPRPDDPIPRRPPAAFAGIARVGPGLALKLGVKRSTKVGDADKDTGADEGSAKKRLKKGTAVIAADASGSFHDLGKNARPGAAAGAASAGLFKVPLLPPSKARGKLAATSSDADVFDAPPDDALTGTDAEVQNKMFIKKAAVRLLGAAGIGRNHADFKEFFNYVYRGTAFALRAKLKTPGLESDRAVVELVDRIAQAHITLYLGGQGVGVYLLQ